MTNRRLARWMFFPPFVAVVALAVGLDQHREQETCRDIRDSREAIQALVIEATSPGGSLDFSRIPGFSDLEPQDQRFWTEVGRILASDDDNEAQRQRLLATVPDVEC